MASAFEIYLRTGRRVAEPTETKFNPWHNPEDGRFTFAGQGRYFPGRHGRSRSEGSGRSGSRPVRDAGAGVPDPALRPGRTAIHGSKHDPKNPHNYSLHTVQLGETLSKIARLRKGLTAGDLAWLNELSADRPLRIGQKIKLPHQSFLDEGKRARETFLELAHYMDMTDGKLPPNVARPPSLAVQIEALGVREIRKNGYAYDIDVLRRQRLVTGELKLQTETRSRKLQSNAGMPDRRTTDDGGHFIAARFNGPREWFNHFAQNANFNRGAYRRLEDEWARAIRSGKRVFVDITPHYRGTSKRPYKLRVVWYVGGRRQFKEFNNEKGGQ